MTLASWSYCFLCDIMSVTSLWGDFGRVFFGSSSLIFVNVFFHQQLVMCGDSHANSSCYESSFVDIKIWDFCVSSCLCPCVLVPYRPLISIQSTCISVSAEFSEHCVLSNTTNPNVSSQSIVKIRSGSTARSLSHLWSKTCCWDKSQASSLCYHRLPWPPYLPLSVGRRL